jgi:hypothetical protein
MNANGVDERALQAEIFDLCMSLRRVFEAMLADALGHQRTAGACAYASIMVADALGRFLPVIAYVEGGGGGDGGYAGARGELFGHYWVRVCSQGSSLSWVVDVTADQFGSPPVLVLPSDEAAARYRPGDQQLCDAGIAELLESIGAAGAQPSSGNGAQ